MYHQRIPSFPSRSLRHLMLYHSFGTETTVNLSCEFSMSSERISADSRRNCTTKSARPTVCAASKHTKKNNNNPPRAYIGQ